VKKIRITAWGLRALFLLFAVMLSSISNAQDQEMYDGTITILEGQTKILPYPGVTQISIGHPDVANAASTAPNEVLLTGLKAGTTDIRVWAGGRSEKRYLLKVLDQSWVKVFEAVKLILGDIEGIRVREDQGIVFVEGRVLREQDVDVVNSVKERFQDQIKRGVLILNVVFPAVSMKSMVLLQVQVVEVRNSELNNVGIEWDSAMRGPFFQPLGTFHGAGNFTKNFTNAGNLPGGGKTFLGFGYDTNGLPYSELNSMINVMAQKGVAKVLAEPRLVTRSGSRAEFRGGGQIPLPVVNADGRESVSFKDYGVILNMEPIADPDGYIAVKVEVEVSSIDPSVIVRDIPGLITRNTKNEMNLQSGQTMVISGLLNAEDSKTVSKIPGIGSLPIIGELFKSRNFQEKKSELVIFVTPRLVDPEGDENKKAMRYRDQLIKKADNDSKFSIFD